MKTKPFRQTHCRTDWPWVCQDVMRYCLRLKLRTYEKTFGQLLRESAGKPIVEESRRHGSDIWSARATKDDYNVLTGDNTLGLLLMELRTEFLALEPGQHIAVPDHQWLLSPKCAIAAEECRRFAQECSTDN